MIEKFKSKITSNEFLLDCKNFKAIEQTYNVSYLEFIQYFKKINTITKHNVIIGINFTYGWMPTIFDFRSKNFDESIEILNNAKNGTIPTAHQLETLKRLFNNSLVGTTKLLHFINPKVFAIWDSRVYRYLTKNEPYSYRIGNSETYLSFLYFINDLTQLKQYDEIHKSICAKLGYQITKLRSAELIMYLNGGKETR